MNTASFAHIDSVKHEALKKMRDFQQKKSRDEHFLAVIDGAQEIGWALERKSAINQVITTPACQDSPLVQSCAALGTEIFVAKESIYDRYFSKFAEEDGVAALVSMHKAQVSPPKKLSLFLETIIDPGNLGTIVRSASSFGINHFFGTDVDWFSKKAIRASRGAHFSSQFLSFDSTAAGLTKLKEAGYQIIGTSPHAKSLISLAQLEKKPAVLMIGNEQDGLSDTALEQADILVCIPMMSDMESLSEQEQVDLRSMLSRLTHHCMDILHIQG